MRIALDYDGTFTRAPDLWRAFIASANAAGHEVICITEREPEDEPTDIPCKVYCTGGESKVRFSGAHNLDIAIWIDDRPHRLMLAD